MSFSIYLNSSDKNPSDQINDLMKNYILNSNTRIILGFANFNITDSDTIPGIDNMSADDIKNLVTLVHNSYPNTKDIPKISLSIGGNNLFTNSELYSKPTELADNINKLLIKHNFDGVDFNIGNPSPVPSDFINNTSSLINTLRSINKDLNITLTTGAQAWVPDNYEKYLIRQTIDNINAWQVMEHDLDIFSYENYFEQIRYDVNYYINTWRINPNKIIVIIKPGIDNTGIDNDKHNLSLSDALSVTKLVKDTLSQGMGIWTSFIDSKVCDGNDPNTYSTEIKTLLELYPPGPYPPPPDPPTSKPFTKDEIDKIRVNLQKLFSLNQSMNMQQEQIIDDVFNRLHGSSQDLSDDPKSENWAIIAQTIMGFVAVALAESFPVVDFIAIIAIGIVDYLSQKSPILEENRDIYLDVDCSNLIGRVTKTYNAQQIYNGYMHDVPNRYRDQELSYLNIKYTLRDFINIDIPEQGSSLYSTIVELNGRQFRQQITIPEMIKMNYWNIYFIEDAHVWPDPINPKDLFGYLFFPQYVRYLENQRKRDFNKENVGIGCRIFANDEIWSVYPNTKHAEAFGSNNDNLKESYINAIQSFIKQFPSAMVGPWTVTNKKTYSFRWYICQDNSKVTNKNPYYHIANEEFMQWLFIDDSVGNVVNTEGVLYRNDALASGIFNYNNYIPKDNVIDDGEQVLFKSSDTEYLYPGCSVYVTSNRVYCGTSPNVRSNTKSIEKQSIFKNICSYISKMCCRSTSTSIFKRKSD